jgi:predicted secreted hydrolase
MNKTLVYLILITLVLVAIVSFGASWLGRQEQAGLKSNLVLAAQVDDSSAQSQGYTRASGPIPFVFPDDFGPHPDYQTEWWYYTGNLSTPEGRHFGYQLTFFRRALLPPNLQPARTSPWATGQAYMAHFAVSDVQANDHYAFERLARGSAGIAGAQSDPYKVWLEDWKVEMIEPQIYRLTASQAGVSLNLILTDTKGPIPHGDQGYSQKGPEPGNASYYYSQTRLLSDGSITIGNQAYSVTGLSWKDHEYSTSALSEGQIGWDWFSIQLENNTEIMVFQIRRDDGSIDPYSSGSLIAADGSVEHISADDFKIKVLDTWKSPTNGAIYPSRWEINIPNRDIRLILEPHMADQEMNLTYSYWEGAVRVTGNVSGVEVNGNGYVEMTGYAGSMSGEF